MKYILILFLKIMPHQKIYTFCSGIMLSMMMKHHHHLLKSFEQIEVIKEVVLPKASKLNK